MKLLKTTFLVLFVLFNSCKSYDSTIERTVLSYQKNDNTTLIKNFLVLNSVAINGKWDKTYYIDEFDTKKKNYFLYLKEGENILGLFFKNNSTVKTNATEKEYFTNTITKEFGLLDDANLKYTKQNTDGKTYQTYTYKDLKGIDFDGLIGLRNKTIYHLTLQNKSLNNTAKEMFLIDMFKTMKP